MRRFDILDKRPHAPESVIEHAKQDWKDANTGELEHRFKGKSSNAPPTASPDGEFIKKYSQISKDRLEIALKELQL